MGSIDWSAAIAVAVILAGIVGVGALVVWPAEESREAREQAELDRRGRAALDALRELGQRYPRR